MTNTILIVDDDPAVNISLVNYLEDFDYDTMSVLSAEEALDAAASQLFSLGIIDLRLPKMDGQQLICELHKVQPNMKFLIHTGSTEFILPSELKALGLEEKHVLNKPLSDLSVLLELIEQLTH